MIEVQSEHIELLVEQKEILQLQITNTEAQVEICNERLILREKRSRFTIIGVGVLGVILGFLIGS